MKSENKFTKLTNDQIIFLLAISKRKYGYYEFVSEKNILLLFKLDLIRFTLIKEVVADGDDYRLEKRGKELIKKIKESASFYSVKNLNKL